MKTIKSILFLFGAIFIHYASAAQEKTSDFNYFPKSDYNSEIVAQSNYAGNNTLEKIVIDGFSSKVPFYRIQPKEKRNDQFVILLHGITGEKNDWIEPSLNWHRVTDSLLTLGYSVLIPDAKYHGERSYEANFASPYSFFATQDTEKVYHMFSTTLKDTRIIMDYIQSTSGEQPVSFNVIGYSMGGIISMLLNAVDDRLNQVVACVPPFDGVAASRRVGMSPEKARSLEVISAKNYADSQKAPITLLMGTSDGWYTQQQAKDFFQSITLKDKTLKFYESGHMLPDAFVADAINGIVEK